MKYIDLAKLSIEETLENKSLIDKEAVVKENPELLEPKACFVTLKLDGKLRGCIGSIVPTKSFFDDLVSNAKSSAFSDNRFEPLTKEEFEKVEVELSLLSIPEEVIYDSFKDLKSKLRSFIHGVIVSFNGKRATFLPQVWNELPDEETFLAHLLVKANIEVKDVSLFEGDDKPEFFTYEVEVID